MLYSILIIMIIMNWNVHLFFFICADRYFLKIQPLLNVGQSWMMKIKLIRVRYEVMIDETKTIILKYFHTFITSLLSSIVKLFFSFDFVVWMSFVVISEWCGNCRNSRVASETRRFPFWNMVFRKRITLF